MVTRINWGFGSKNIFKFDDLIIKITFSYRSTGFTSIASIFRVRNPQGIALSPFDNKIYMTNHGAKGGDWFGTANFGENYGWKILGWGGTNYSGTKIGPKWKPGFTKAIKYWVPSIAVSAMTIYKGDTFREWEGDALIASLKDQSLRKIKFKDNKFVNEEIIFRGNIGRIRDIKIQKETGDLFMLSDKGQLWKMYK